MGCSLMLKKKKLVRVQLIEFPAARLVIHVTPDRYEDFEIGIKLHRLFMKIHLLILKPADHPLVDSFPSFERSTMQTRSDKKAQLISSAVEAKQPPGFLIDEPGACGREIVTVGCQD